MNDELMNALKASEDPKVWLGLLRQIERVDGIISRFRIHAALPVLARRAHVATDRGKVSSEIEVAGSGSSHQIHVP